MSLPKFLVISLTVSAATTCAFVPQHHVALLQLSSTRLFAGKGFGSTPPSKPPKRSLNEESDRTIANPQQQDDGVNMGQKALQELRRQRAEQRDEELRKVREVRSVDEYLEATPDAAVIPEKVAMRMGSRMLPFVGLPLLGGMGAFVTFWYLATYRNMEFQPSMVAFTTIGILALGLVVSTCHVVLCGV